MANEPKNKKLLGLYKKNHCWAVRELVDQDYIHKLSPELQEYVAKFNSEFYDDSHGNDPLHNKPEVRSENSFNKSLARRDLMNVSVGELDRLGPRSKNRKDPRFFTKAVNKSIDFQFLQRVQPRNNTEDLMIALVDLKKKHKK